MENLKAERSGLHLFPVVFGLWMMGKTLKFSERKDYREAVTYHINLVTACRTKSE